MSTTIPSTHRALVQTVYGHPLNIQEFPTPSPTPGSALVKILYSGVLSYSKDVYNGTRRYPYPVPIVPGVGAVGRIAALGPDSTSLQIGQLVVIDPMIRSRDEPNDLMLLGLVQGGTAGGEKLIKDVWRDGTYAEYTLVPLENCLSVNEEKISKLGYDLVDLAGLSHYLVPFGGLRDINAKVGETVIVAPATGAFGAGAVAMAISMGLQVIAMGRNETILQGLKEQFGSEKVKTVKITNDEAVDGKALRDAAQGPVDVVLEISPPMASKSSHIRSAIMALRRGGRVSLMGGILDDYALPFRKIMRDDIMLKGKWMYEREDAKHLMRLIEDGVLKVGSLGGVKTLGGFGLEDWEKAFEVASKEAGWDKQVVLKP